MATSRTLLEIVTDPVRQLKDNKLKAKQRIAPRSCAK